MGFDRRAHRPVGLTFLPIAIELPPLLELPWPGTEDPSVARVLELVRSDDGLVVVTELALGPALGALIAFQQPPQLVALLIAQALEGLSVLHRAGRAHGSLSPAAWVIDARVHRVRLVDLWLSWLPPPPGDEVRAFTAPELWERASPATEEDRIRGDVYALGRLAEALLRGGPPMGAWAPLVANPRFTDEARRSFTMLSAWIARCQATTPGERFPDAGAALEALRPLPVEGEVALARAAASLRLPYFTQIERALRAWSRSPAYEQGTHALSYLGAVSSFRAGVLWKAIAVAAVAIGAGSVGLAVRPRPPAPGQWPATACLESATPRVLDAAGAGGPGVLRLKGAVPELLAIDGCPIPGSEGLRLGLSLGEHQLRAESAGRRIAQAIEVDAGAALELTFEKLAVATGSGADAIAGFRAGLRKLTDRAAAARADPQAPAQPVPEESARTPTPYERGLLEPEVRELLDLDRRFVALSPAVRANLPDGLALWLDALRAAAGRFSATEGVCTARAKQEIQVFLDQRQPDARPNLQGAIEALAVGRLLATGEANRPIDEAALMQKLGVTDSPMLRRAVHDLVLDPELRRCVDALRPKAAEVRALAAPQLAEYGEWTAWSHEP